MDKAQGKGLLYRNVAGILKNEMDSGIIASGEQLPGVRELAARFETSGKTISRVLDELETSGYIERTQGRGIFALRREGQVSASSGGSWGCLCTGGDEGADALVRALEEEAGHEGRELLIRRYDGGTEETSALLHGLGEKGVEGVFIVSSALPSQVFGPSGLPCLLLGGAETGVGFRRGSWILWDLAGGIDSCVEHLASAGHLALGFIEESPGEGAGPGANCFRDSLVKRGLEWEFDRVLSLVSPGDEVELAVKKLLMRDADVTALVCMHDRLAAGAIRAASQAGLSVPEDLCVTGFGGTELGAAAAPALTTLAWDPAAMAAAALACMNRMIVSAGMRQSEIRLLQPLELIVRGSSVSGSNGVEDRWV